jgi:glycosyltransferase involved in cell wall biosynthesis
MNARLLVLSRYSRLGASSRLRTLQYRPYIEDAGFEVEYTSLFDDKYLQRFYSGQSSLLNLPRYYGKRVWQIKKKPAPSLIWIEYEALPWLPFFLESALISKSIPIISDFDDAVFHKYDLHKLKFVRRLLGNKIDQIMKNSRLVMAGNNYLEDRAHQAGAANVEIVPTVVDLSLYPELTQSDKKPSAQIGWIGTPNTWNAFGERIFDTLKPLLEARNACFKAVGAGLVEKTKGTLNIVPWREETEVEQIRDMEIGIMPLSDTPWARGKCGYKLIQYMACGLPVVASPVGVNARIVEHGVNGFLAETNDDWHNAVLTLMNDAGLRHRMGQAGRKKVEENYSLQTWGRRVAAMMQGVVGNA